MVEMSDEELRKYLRELEFWVNNEILSDEQKNRITVDISTREREFREHCGA